MLPLIFLSLLGSPGLQDPAPADPVLEAVRELPAAEARKLIEAWREAAASSPSLSLRWALFSAEDGRPVGGVELDFVAQSQLRLRFQYRLRSAVTLWMDGPDVTLLLEDPEASRRGSIPVEALEGLGARLERLLADAAGLAGVDQERLDLGSPERSWQLPWLRLTDDGRGLSMGLPLMRVECRPGGLFWLDWLVGREDWEAWVAEDSVDFRGPDWLMRVDRIHGLLQARWGLEQGEWRLVIQETRGAVLGGPIPSNRFDPPPLEEGMHDLGPEIRRGIELAGLGLDRWELFLGALRERLAVGDGWSKSHGEAWRLAFREIYAAGFRQVHELGGTPGLDLWLQTQLAAAAKEGAEVGWPEREAEFRASAGTAVLRLTGRARVVASLGLRQAAAAAGSLVPESSGLFALLEDVAQFPARPERQVLLLERKALEEAAVDLALELLRRRFESAGNPAPFAGPRPPPSSAADRS